MTPALAEYLRRELPTVRAPLSDEYMPTEHAPMCHAPYMDTLEAPLEDVMTGNTRPAPFGFTRNGDEVHVRTTGFPVDIDTEAGDLDAGASRLMPLEPGTDIDMDRADEIEAARAAVARMGGGLAEPSRPMPMWPRRMTTAERADRAATLTVISFVAGVAWWHVIAMLMQP